MFDELDQDRLEEYSQNAQQNFHYCLNCQGRDSGEWIWIFGHRVSMFDYLTDLEIPEQFWQAVVNKLECPFCGSSLDLSMDIGLKSEYEIKIDQMWIEWTNRYEFELKDFFLFLEKHPYLGLKHKLGQSILNELQNFPKCDIQDEIYYRARKVSSGKILSSSDMLPPDPKFVSITEGRFNHFGQSVLYLANYAEGAAREILNKGENIVWLQKYKIIKIKNILNLTPDPYNEPSPDIDILPFGLIYSGALSKEVERSVGWKPEYFVSRFISDCSKYLNFNGILFKSTRHYSNNLVLFNWQQKEIETVDEPIVFKYPNIVNI
jgi:hypothetical protein